MFGKLDTILEDKKDFLMELWTAQQKG